MSKRKMSLIICMALAICMFGSMTVNAAADSVKTVPSVEETFSESEVELQAETRASNSRTVTDWEGNKYKVTGTVYKSGGIIGVAATAFDTTYYGGGTPADRDRVNGYKKTYNVSASVILQGGGSNSFYKNASNTGASRENLTSQNFIYTIITITGTHYFECNGAKTTLNSLE